MGPKALPSAGDAKKYRLREINRDGSAQSRPLSRRNGEAFPQDYSFKLQIPTIAFSVSIHSSYFRSLQMKHAGRDRELLSPPHMRFCPPAPASVCLRQSRSQYTDALYPCGDLGTAGVEQLYKPARLSEFPRGKSERIRCLKRTSGKRISGKQNCLYEWQKRIHRRNLANGGCMAATARGRIRTSKIVLGVITYISVSHSDAAAAKWKCRSDVSVTCPLGGCR